MPTESRFLLLYIFWFAIGLFSSCTTKTHPKSDENIIHDYSETALDSTSSDILFQYITGNINFDSTVIIGCGQSTHGSHENFVIQTELFKYLVLHHGCRSFIMEAPYSNLISVNEYIMTGDGIKDSILNKLGFWIWKTDEVWSLIEWVKIFNENKPQSDKIYFLGNDMQDIHQSILGCKLFFEAYCDTIPNAIDVLLEPFWRITSETIIDQRSQLNLDNNLMRLDLLADSIGENLKSNISFQLGKYNLEILKQACYLSQQQVNAIGFRDSLMALNTRYISTLLANSVVFIWGHNGHVGVDQSKYRNMGAYLRQAYSSYYYSIGIDFVQGSFNARKYVTTSNNISTSELMDPSSCTVNYSIPNPLLDYANNNRDEYLVINLRSAYANSIFRNSKMYVRGSIHSIGAGYNPESTDRQPGEIYKSVIVKEEFDFLILFKFSTPTRLIRNH